MNYVKSTDQRVIGAKHTIRLILAANPGKDPREVLVAGGYVRDLILDVPSKDMDVFVYEAEGETVRLPFDGLNSATQDWQQYSAWALDRGLKAIHNVEGTDIQIIVMSKPVMQSAFEHDFGICNAFIDHLGDVGVHGTFMEDFAQKTFTLTRCENLRQYVRSMSRWHNRFAARYPESRLVVPPQFAHYADLVETLGIEV